jgi:putative oxidoreductase
VNFLERLQPLGLLVLRLALGVVMIAHGWQKIADHLHMFSGILHGLGIAHWMVYLVVVAEFGGGILLVLGFLTRLAAFAVLVDMLVAIFTVHLHNGVLGHKGAPGFELPMTCAAIALALIFSGAGPIAIDWLWGSKGR